MRSSFKLAFVFVGIALIAGALLMLGGMGPCGPATIGGYLAMLIGLISLAAAAFTLICDFILFELRKIKLLKRVSSLLLATSFFLPLTQCSQKVGEKAAPVAIAASNAYSWPGMFSTIVLFVFFWPMAIQLWRLMARVHSPSLKAIWTEVGLSAFSIAGITWLVLPWSVNLGASIRYGAYLAYGSAFTYGVLSLVDARSKQSLCDDVESTE